MCYWSDSNPHVLHESSLYPEKLRFMSRTSSLMFKTVQWLDYMDLEDMWFQQNGATSHTANVTINLLEIKFGERYLTKWSSRLAASVLRFDGVRLFPVSLGQVYSLCQQDSDD